MDSPRLDEVLRQSSRRRSGVKIVLQTDDLDFIALATRALECDGRMSFIHDASTFEHMEEPVDLHAQVVAVM